MERLVATDVAAVGRVMHEIGEAPDVDALRACVLGHLHGLIACDVVSVEELVPHEGMRQASTPVVDVEDELRAYFVEHMLDHPMIAHFACTGDAAPHRFGHFLSDRQLHALPIWCDLFRHVGVERQAGFPASGGAPFVGVTVTRASGMDFTERDLTVLALLQPLVVASFRVVTMRARLRAASVSVDGVAPSRTELRAHGLSEREAEVMELVVAGNTTEDIAAALFVSRATIRKHLERIYARLGVHSRAEATARVTGVAPVP